MKVPLKWLEEYVPLALPAAELAERLTMAGLEVVGARLYGVPRPEGLRVKEAEVGPVWARDKVFVAQVLRVEKHPNADKLKLPIVTFGEGRTQQLVTGAPNINVGDVGQKVVLGLAGTVFYDGHVAPKKLAELKPKPVRGVPSEGMVMSSFELGIDEEHEGIIVLDPDAPVGVPAADYMGDVVLDVDVLPNMARCLSLIGVAREVAALTGEKLRLPATTPTATGRAIDGLVRVSIEDAKLSPRYAAGLIQGVTVGPAPVWMQRRLSYAGMRPINNIVDITNYVMLEWGQPLHAFDHDKLVVRAKGKPPHIIVRPARAGEVLRTLDGQDRKLTADMLVIADEAGPIALAGVMGGAETEVSDATKNVLLESANFDFVSIRRTMRALDLPSEASQRFSKGIHPALVPLALGRASELMRLHAGGAVCKGVVDAYPAPRPPQVVELKLSEVRRTLGVDLVLEGCMSLLRSLEFEVEPVGADALRATVPPHRLDIQEGAADLIEELARQLGYDRMPATLMREHLPEQANNEPLQLEERVRDRLICAGLQEVICYSLTTPEREAPLGLPKEYVRLLNPISAERTVMRRSLLTGLLDVAAANLKHTDTVRLFEVGSAYLPREGRPLPDEPRRLGLLLSGRRGQEFWAEGAKAPAPGMDFFDLKGVVEALLADLHIAGPVCRHAKVAALHPARSAEVSAGGRVLGAFGELHPKVAEAFDLAGRQVLVGELDLDAVRAAVPPRFAYAPISRYQAALRDIAVVVEEGVTAEKVAAEVRAGGGELVRDVRLFDVYQGPQVPAGHKSLAYALTYQADDRTLTDKEVDKAHKKVEDRLRHVLKATVRGEDG
jgi:phenylalanyl-tRNA synthetase beta chain